MLRPLSAICALAVSGCVMLTKDPSAVRSSTEAATTACANVSSAEAVSRLEDIFRRCHERRTAPSMPIMSGTLVVGYTQGGRSQFAVESRPTTGREGGTVVLRDIRNGNVMLMADILEAPSCKAEVQLRGSNFAWQNWAIRAKDLINDQNATCPII